MKNTVTRRTALATTAAAPLALTKAVDAAQDADPAVCAFHAAVEADAAYNEAYRLAEEASPRCVIEFAGKRAHSAQGIDHMIEQYRTSKIFAGVRWIGPRTPEQQERDRARKEATAAPVPDAGPLKADLADQYRRHEEIFEAYKVDELREAYYSAEQALIDTPATTFEGIAAKLRLAVGVEEKANAESAESLLTFAAIADAERLAQS